MKVEIYSDLVCPWCYIGKRRFEKALAAFPEAANVDVVYRPFQLNPAAPETTEPSAHIYERKFGRPAATIFGPLTSAASAEGITFRMDDALATNTFQAHRLLWFARRHGRQAEVKERLLAHYFTDGGNLGDREALAGLAEAAASTAPPRWPSSPRPRERTKSAPSSPKPPLSASRRSPPS